MAEVGITVVYLLTVMPVVTCELIIYPVAAKAPTSDKFQIHLTQDGQQKQSHVYITTSDHRTTEASHVKGGRSMSWTSFAFTGSKVTVEVHTSRDFQNCIVRPKSYGYTCRRTENMVAVFDVTENTKMMSVEFDYDYGSDTDGHDITDKLMVFADPPETSKPSKTDPSVLYYDVEVYNLNGQLELNSNIREVYLAPGAFVKGGFKSTASLSSGMPKPVKIHGRGVLDNRDYKWKDPKFSYAAINLEKDKNYSIVEGITISDPCRFYVRALGTNNIINNVKMVGAWMYNNDGVVVGNNGTVADCFIHANDDAIKLHGYNIKVTRCVVWQAQNGAVFQTGWWTTTELHRVKVSNIDIIHIDWCTFKNSSCNLSVNKAVFNHPGNTTRSMDISDVVMEDIRVEGTCPRVVYLRMELGTRGMIKNIRFVNWNIERQLATDKFHNEIEGTEPGFVEVTDLQFINFRIEDRCASSAAEAGFHSDNSKVNNWTFWCISNSAVGNKMTMIWTTVMLQYFILYNLFWLWYVKV